MKKHTSAIAILVASAFFLGAYSEPSLSDNSSGDETAANESQAPFNNLDDRFSYAYGIEMAEKFKAEGIALNPAVLAAAIEDVLDDGERKMSAGEVTATIEVYQEIHTKKKRAERAAVGETNQKKGEAFLAENARKNGVVVTESGLQYKVVEDGNGGQKPTSEDEVTVHYRATFVDGTEFDSTYKRDEAYTSKVKDFIEGWTEALQLMSEGAKWELYIPAELAYGEEGSGEYVGPNSVLIFEAELLDVES